MIDKDFFSLRARVNAWALDNAVDDFMYGSPYSYWSSAASAGVCSDAELRLAEKRYGAMWHYRGD